MNPVLLITKEVEFSILPPYLGGEIRDSKREGVTSWRKDDWHLRLGGGF